MAGSSSEDGRPEVKATPPSNNKSVMKGAKTEIGLASATILVPMLALSVVLIALVYSNQMPNYDSTYMIGDGPAKSLGSAYYVEYSATTLVYIASLSSTAATLLLSAAMLLFSYQIANTFAKQSDRDQSSLLPSPYQLGLLIRMIDGRLMAMWSYILYIFGLRRNRIKIVPVLWQASTLMIVLVVLVGLITLADLWLHLGTKSVQYIQLKPYSPSFSFAPSRDLAPSCLSDPRGTDPRRDGGIDTSIPADCIIWRGDAVNKPTLVNQTEFIRTAGNQSAINQVVYDAPHTVLGPYNPPNELDFEATTFGANTSCRVVTSECGANSITGSRNAPPYYSNFKCNDTAGLNMTGNFLALERNDTGQVPALYGGPRGGDTSIQKGNSLRLSDFDMGFQYFQGAAKQQQVDVAEVEQVPDTARLDWAVVFQLHLNWAFWVGADNPSGLPIKNITGELNPWDALNLAGNAEGGANGIISCQTEISEIHYKYTNGTLRVKEKRPPRANASIPFVRGITDPDWPSEQLHQGLQQSFVRAKNPDDLAAGFAQAYDQVLLSVPAGVMQPQPAINVTRRVMTQVARVPIAPFITLIVLNLLYAILGVVLTVVALLALSTGSNVRDAQARLSVNALVAENFENFAFTEDAKSVDELFAEVRGKPTKRVALRKWESGGRMYGQTGPHQVAEGGELLK